MEEINIKETVKLPSRALELMVTGIRKQTERPDFRLDMSSFGYYLEYSGICFGCAATCTIQEIAQKNLSMASIEDRQKRAVSLGFDISELALFEDAMDDARKGMMDALFIFFDMELTDNQEFQSKESRLIADFYINEIAGWHLDYQLTKVEAYIKELKAAGY